MNRREFVASSSAFAAAVGCRGLAATPFAKSPPLDVAWVLYDRRFEPSRAFGLAAADLKLRTYGTDGDITKFWAEHLDALWRGGAGAVAGMTTATTLVCLEQLAAQHWFRVIGRVEHEPRRDRTIQHRIRAESRWIHRLRGGLANDDGLTNSRGLASDAGLRRFAAALLAPGRRGIRPANVELLTNTNGQWLDSPPLVSWYIASRTTEVEV